MKPNPRRFHLFRTEDPTGVSGTGRVAEGVEFSDGTCAMRWLTKHTSTAVYSRMADILMIHGHDGKTEVRWLDFPASPHPSGIDFPSKPGATT